MSIVGDIEKWKREQDGPSESLLVYTLTPKEWQQLLDELRAMSLRMHELPENPIGMTVLGVSIQVETK